MQLYRGKSFGDEGASKYRPVASFKLIPSALLDPGRLMTLDQLTSQGTISGSNQEFIFQGKTWRPFSGLHWKTTVEGLERLASTGRIVIEENSLRFFAP